MKHEDIIRMAEEACGEPAWDGGVEWTWEEVERFAHLVAAAEREACANLVEQAGIDGYGTIVAALLIRERSAP